MFWGAEQISSSGANAEQNHLAHKHSLHPHCHYYHHQRHNIIINATTSSPWLPNFTMSSGKQEMVTKVSSGKEVPVSRL
jgi:hypothetical protein